MCQIIHKESENKNLHNWRSGLLKQELNLYNQIIGQDCINLEIGFYRIL